MHNVIIIVNYIVMDIGKPAGHGPDMTTMDRDSCRPTTRKAAQSAATRARLLEAARRLFAERGYDDVGVTEIARAAGVTHALIKVYFNSKAGLLYEVVAENNRAQIARSAKAAASAGSTLDRLMRLVAVWIAGDLRDARLASVMLAYSWEWPKETERVNRAQLAEAFRPARRIIEEGVAAGELRAEVDPDDLIQALYAIYLWELRPAIFDDAPREACQARIRRQIGLLLDGARPAA